MDFGTEGKPGILRLSCHGPGNPMYVADVGAIEDCCKILATTADVLMLQLQHTGSLLTGLRRKFKFLERVVGGVQSRPFIYELFAKTCVNRTRQDSWHISAACESAHRTCPEIGRPCLSTPS